MSFAIETRLITAEAELTTAFLDEWRQLVLQTEHPNPFLTPEFMLACWEHMLDKPALRCICFRDTTTQSMVGIVPLYAQSDTHWRSLSHVDITDYWSPIFDQKYQEKLVELLFRFLQDRGVAALQLECLSEPLELTQALLVRGTATVQEVVPTIKLPGEWETYLGSLDRKQRHEVRRKHRNSLKAGASFEIDHGSDEGYHDFVRLHQLSSAEKKAFWTETKTAFFTAVMQNFARQGWVRLFFLTVSGERLASMLIFEYAQSSFLYNSGYDPSANPRLGAGTVLTAYTIQHAIEMGHAYYDFLRGDEVYKFRLGGIAHDLIDLSLPVHKT